MKLYKTRALKWDFTVAEEQPMKKMCFPHIRYLIAKDEGGKCVGMSHFRFDLDEGDEVLYW